MRHLLSTRAKAELVKRLKAMGGRLLLMSDFDGTLAPLAKHPQEVALPPSTLDLLSQLASQSNCILALVSGRSQGELNRLVGLTDAYYIGNHGLELCGPGLERIQPSALRAKNSIARLAWELKGALADLPGVVVEDKVYSLSVHYRQLPASLLSRLRGRVKGVLRQYEGIKVRRGKKVIDIGPAVDWGKDVGVKRLMRELSSSKGWKGIPIYLGDDKSDEEAFRYLSGRGVTVVIGPKWKRSSAHYYLRDPDEVRSFLAWLLTVLRAEGKT